MWPAPERDVWRRRSGILSASDLRRAMREHPAWRLNTRRLVRELRFKDFVEAIEFVERIASEAVDFGRYPDICILDGSRVRVSVGSPRHAGVTVGDVRLIEKVDAMVEQYMAGSMPVAPDGIGRRAARGGSHEHPLPA